MSYFVKSKTFRDEGTPHGNLKSFCWIQQMHTCVTHLRESAFSSWHHCFTIWTTPKTNPQSMLSLSWFKSGKRSGGRPLSGASGWSEQSRGAIWSLPPSDHIWWPQDATLWQKVPNYFNSVQNYSRGRPITAHPRFTNFTSYTSSTSYT